jgi:8-oxo-dGTP pyrophosphatase MutT (NUDIX family)
MRLVPAQREFAAAILVDTQGRLLLQLRDNVPGIAYPGWVGLFGGHREAGETYLECVRREVHEETGLLLPPERFMRLASHSRTEPDGTRVVGDLFIVHGIAVDDLSITEGSLLIAAPGELAALMPRLAPSARAAVQAFSAGRG